MPKKIVQWSTKAQAQVAGIDRETALEILHAIDDYLTAGVGEVKKLRPPRQELRLRVGDYRVFFLSHGPQSIEVLAVKHRREAYRWRDLELRYKISFWDALIVQAAGSCGAEVLYSEDLADGQSYGEVRVINPLK